MYPIDEFLKHADECERMAKFTRDHESMATWNRMAERWRRCAEKFTSQELAVRHPMSVRRRQNGSRGLAHQ